jgi:pimeloyl-ACP methyl ester carboxylesterase
VVHAASGHPAPDPIVFLDGGPSFGGISTFALDLYFAGASYAADHDLVLVDTRGTGLSTPNLACPELDQAELDAFYAPPSVNAQGLPIYRRALRDCRSRLVGGGAQLSLYNTAESAADIEALRQSLGVRQWNLFALSADGSLGLTYLRLFPNGIRSAVIDSGMSTQMLWGLEYDRGLAEELESIFSGCAANTACRNAYPGIRHRFYKLVHHLQRHPVMITFPDYLPHPVRLRMDGVGLYLDTLFSIFPGNRFAPDTIHDLLATVWRQTHGELVETYRELFGTGPAESSHINDVLAQGKTMSYVCHDSVGFFTHHDLHQPARDIPPFAPRYLDPDYDWRTPCCSPSRRRAVGCGTSVSPQRCRANLCTARSRRWFSQASTTPVCRRTSSARWTRSSSTRSTSSSPQVLTCSWRRTTPPATALARSQARSWRVRGTRPTLRASGRSPASTSRHRRA